MMIYQQTRQAAHELLETARLTSGDIFVVGCSTSEVLGQRIGTAGTVEVAQQIARALHDELDPLGVFLAVQCCEHLNRALVVSRACQRESRWQEVCVLPQPHAGGSLATAAYQMLPDPCVVSSLQARAGMDIGGVLIGMHLMPVAVPVRISLDRIGEARLLLARTRPPLIGGERAKYPPK